MKRKQSLVGSIRVMTTVFLILLALFILIVELGIHSKNHATRLDIERERFYRDQSEFMEGEINRIIERIAFQTGQVKLKLEKEVKARALEGYVIAQALYENGKENKSPAVLQKEILETLRLLSYKDGTGYYFVINLDGVTLMNKAAPHVENRNNLSSRDRAGRFHVKEMVELVRKEREGYYSYLWFKPENREENLTKNAYLKYFEPYDWLIGTGLYEEDTKRELQKSLLASIEYVYSQNPSPLFIAHKNGALLLGSGKGRNIMEEGSLEERVQFRKLILTAEQGGGFLEFPALSSEGTECRRLYFVREIEDWDWIIGTSQYTDKLEIEIQNMENYEKIIQREEVLRIMLITLLSCLMLIFLLNGMNKYFLQDLSYFSRFFKQTAMDDIPMDQEKLRYREFTDLGVYANRMVGEKKKREEEKHRLRNLESLGFLASGIAHEFNNALMGIFGNIELSLQNPEDKQNIQLHLERALEAMDYTKSLTNRLLTFSKGGQPNCELLSLGELVREAGENWQEKERFSFVNTLASSDFRIKADKTQLLLVMDMLFSNAYEAMKEKGTLTVRGKRVTLENAFPSRLTGSYIRLDIEDTGKGIDEKIREKIFDLYFSTKLTGHGLGLPTAYNILKNHRGHMEIQSVKGRGTTVSLYLPEADLSTEADSTDLE